MSQDAMTGQRRAPRAARGEDAAGRRQLAAVFAVTSLGAFMSSLDLSIVNVAFPALARSFPHDSRAALAWVITGYAVAFGALMVSGGRTADRLGRPRTFLAGIAVFCAGSAVCAAAPVLAVLVAPRKESDGHR